VNKNNSDEILLKRSLGQSEGVRTARGRGRLEEQAVEGNGPKWRPVVRKDVRKKRHPVGARRRRRNHGMVVI